MNQIAPLTAAASGDAARALWEACTEQYSAAADEAVRGGGDVPETPCDSALAAVQDQIQQHWGSPEP